MFGLSFWEIAVILAVALIVLGPSKLPEIARSLGKGLREFRKATQDFKSTIDDEVYRPEENKPRAPELPGPAAHNAVPATGAAAGVEAELEQKAKQAADADHAAAEAKPNPSSGS
jgi:TatA/E family protein of Tat protein translocase